MAKLYKRTDRVTVKIDDITIKLAPLSFDQKTEIQDLMARGQIKKEYSLLQKGISSAIKYAVKDIQGVEDASGNKYNLSFDEAGNLTDECIDDLYNLEMHPKLVMVCSSLIKNIPNSFTDNNGEPIEGVEILTGKTEVVPDPN